MLKRSKVACVELVGGMHPITSSDLLVTFAPGTGESGKSTFIKQMRIIHGKGYGRQESMNFRSLIFRNIYTAVQTLIEAMQTLAIPYEFPELQERLSDLTSVKLDYVESLGEGHQELISKLWADRGVLECFARRREFQISDSAE